MKYITKVASAIIFIYLCGAFITWDFNAGNWPEIGRLYVAFIVSMIIVGALSVNSFED